MTSLARTAAGRDDSVRIAGLAAAAVPLAVLVHLIAEFAALGAANADDFALRHLYLIPLAAGAAFAFARALGNGRGRGEFVRRSALARAALRRTGLAGVGALFATNLAFFAATQAIEGVPIATGSVTTGLVVATLGSLLAACMLFAFGRNAVVVVRAVVLRATTSPAGAIALERRRARCTRRAGRTFSLFLPNRPPPFASLA